LPPVVELFLRAHFHKALDGRRRGRRRVRIEGAQ